MRRRERRFDAVIGIQHYKLKTWQRQIKCAVSPAVMWPVELISITPCREKIKAIWKCTSFVICSSVTFYFHSLAIECTSTMPANVHDVRCEATEFVSICFGSHFNDKIVIVVCAHMGTWQTRAGFRMVAVRQTHTILLRLQQSPKSINIYNSLSAKWFFGRALHTAARLRWMCVQVHDEMPTSCAFVLLSQRNECTNCILRILGFIVFHVTSRNQKWN